MSISTSTFATRLRFDTEDGSLSSFTTAFKALRLLKLELNSFMLASFCFVRKGKKNKCDKQQKIRIISYFSFFFIIFILENTLLRFSFFVFFTIGALFFDFRNVIIIQSHSFDPDSIIFLRSLLLFCFLILFFLQPD